MKERGEKRDDIEEYYLTGGVDQGSSIYTDFKQQTRRERLNQLLKLLQSKSLIFDDHYRILS